MQIGFAGLLALLFIGLKLTNNIEWSWLWVLSPLWIPLAVFVFFISLSGGTAWLLRKLETDEERKLRNVREALDGMQKALRKNSK